jgi:Gametolysin peptidase M11
MHEMGHGLGFKHSGNGVDEYADKTGYMGYAVNYQAMPRKAFVSIALWGLS